MIEYNCEKCGQHVKKQELAYLRNPFYLCKRCLMIKKYGSASNGGRQESKQKISKTNKIKANTFETQEKRRKTCLQKYGRNTTFNPEKTKKTSLEKYGTEWPTASDEIKEKIKNNNLKKYGVSCPSFQLEEFKQKSKETIKLKYGSDHPLRSPEIKEKIKETCNKKYGRPYTFNFKKSKETCLKKYGVENPSQNENILKKMLKSRFPSYTYNNEKFDSSWELAYWIYCKDNDIDIKRSNKSFLMNNGHKCFPDFEVNGELVEIKGDHLKKYENWQFKLKCYNENNIKLISLKDIKFYFEYINNTYGKEYLKQFRQKKTQS